jgi:hypothetical protein
VPGPDGAAIITELRNYSGVKVVSANFETATLDSRASVGFIHTVRTLVRIVAVECSSLVWRAARHYLSKREEVGQDLVTVRGCPAATP